MILMSGPIDEPLDYFDVNLKIVSRIRVQQFCFTNAWAVPYLYLLWDGEAVEEPIHLSKNWRHNLMKNVKGDVRNAYVSIVHVELLIT